MRSGKGMLRVLQVTDVRVNYMQHYHGTLRALYKALMYFIHKKCLVVKLVPGNPFKFLNLL